MSAEETPESLRAMALWWDEHHGRGTLVARELRNDADDLEAKNSGEMKQRLVEIRKWARDCADAHRGTRSPDIARQFEKIVRMTGRED